MSDCPYVLPWYVFTALRPPAQCELTARMKRAHLADFFGTCPVITDPWKDSRLCRHDGTPAHPSTHGPLATSAIRPGLHHEHAVAAPIRETGEEAAEVATLELQFPNETGEWVTEATYPLEEFIAKHRSGMWVAEIESVRSLAVGESYWGGGGALPEWRVVRKG